LLACLIASGKPLQDIPHIMQKIYNLKTIKRTRYVRLMMSLAGLLQHKITDSILDETRFRRILDETFGDQMLEHLPIKTYVQTTDFVTGKARVLENGRLADVLYASNAMYPLLPPIQIHGQWLVDGCFSSILPLPRAFQLNPDLIIACHISRQNEPVNNNIECLSNYVIKTCSYSQTSQRTILVNVFEKDTHFLFFSFDKNIGFWDAEKLPEILAMGDKSIENDREYLETLLRDD